MFRRRDRNQLSIPEDNKRFIVQIDPENKWVKLSELMPWDRIEDHYAQNMCEDTGRNAITSRIAFGSIYIKESLNLTDIGTVEQIRENPYLQHFLGLQEYQSAPLFDPSMMVHFRKRFTPEFISQMNEYICTGKWPDDDSTQSPDDLPPPEEAEHKGKLTLDATVAPSDIRHPNDVSLLNECRETLEKYIDELWEASEQKGRKTPYSRHSAHKKHINFIKKKKKSQATIQAALSAQLNYVKMAIQQIAALALICGVDTLSDREWDHFDVICGIYLQQKWMFDNKTNRCSGKVMSLRQPFVRAILRNKARAKYEYGQKLALAKANGFVFVEHQSWENFNECNTLQQSVLNYYNRFGCYPEVILADQIYHTRANMKFCKDKEIRLAGIGKTRKNSDQTEKKQAYKDLCDRNEIEGVNGV
ncbi:MAG: IS5 family transposase, partial [Oscillospiraceae bacterium]|nr:IS5 family transposase [Oscillospiraceae bacterium]